MPRPEKVQAVEEIRERFADASASFITEYRGLTVGQQQDLRNSLREAGASYKVFKLTLTKLALVELGTTELDEFLAGPTAIAFASSDPVPVAKALKDFGDENDALVIKAGWMDGEVLRPEMVAKLASLESRAALLAKIAGAAKAPLIKMAGMLGSMTRDAASMFSQLLENKQDAAPEVVEETVELLEAGADASDVDTATVDDDVSQVESGSDELSSDELSSDEPATDDAPADGDSAEDTPVTEVDTEIKDQEEPAAEESSSDEDDPASAEAADDDTADDDAAEEE